jgi:hypothetical protein
VRSLYRRAENAFLGLVLAAEACRWLRPLAAPIARWFFWRNFHLILQHGQVRHLEAVEGLLREHLDEDIANELREALGDKATFVLERDSQAWRETIS